jgi:hypothetical protein
MYWLVDSIQKSLDLQRHPFFDINHNLQQADGQVLDDVASLDDLVHSKNALHPL